MTVFWAKTIDINNLAFKDLSSDDLRQQEFNIKVNHGFFPSLGRVWEERKIRYPSDFVMWMDEIINSP